VLVAVSLDRRVGRSAECVEQEIDLILLDEPADLFDGLGLYPSS
jgi:hypothetical protein